MAASVRIEDEAFADARVELLGTLAGYSRYEALGRLAHLWRICTQRQMHVVSEAIVNACIGPAGVQHMLDAELADRGAGGIRIRGTSGRIEWLGDLKAKRQQAGKARAASGLRDGAGRLLAAGPAHAGHDSSTQPAESSAPAPAPAPAKEEEDTVSGKPDVAVLLAQTAAAEINRLARRRYRAESDSISKLCRALSKAKRTPEQVIAVVASKRHWIGDPKMHQFFRPKTLLAAENFAAYLDDLEAGQVFAQGTEVRQIATPHDDEPDLTYAGFGVDVTA